jgi:hypothetical protein
MGPIFKGQEIKEEKKASKKICGVQYKLRIFVLAFFSSWTS